MKFYKQIRIKIYNMLGLLKNLVYRGSKVKAKYFTKRPGGKNESRESSKYVNYIQFLEGSHR